MLPEPEFEQLMRDAEQLADDLNSGRARIVYSKKSQSLKGRAGHVTPVIENSQNKSIACIN